MLANHGITEVRTGGLGILSRLSRHESASVSAEDYIDELAEEFEQADDGQLIGLIQAIEHTVIGSPDYWSRLEHRLLPLLASESPSVRRQACKSLLSILSHHPNLPSNPSRLQDRLSELADEFDLRAVYGKQIEQALNQLDSQRPA